MGKKIDLDKAIGHIIAHKEAVKISSPDLTENALAVAEAVNETYALAHNHIIELLIMLASDGEI